MKFRRNMPHIYNIAILWQKEKKTMLVVLLALFFSVSMFFLLLSFLLGGFASLGELEQMKREYDIPIWPKDGQTWEGIEIFDRCIKGDLLPNIEACYLPVEFSCNADEGRWYAVFPGQANVMNSGLDCDLLVAGRWFTNEEIESGAAVTVLDGTAYPDISVGRHIKVAGVEAEVIGIGSQNILPYQFMRNISNEEISFQPGTLCVLFETELSREAEEYLERVLYSSPIRQYDSNSDSSIIFIIQCVCLSVGAMFLIVCNISGAMKRLVDKSKPVYSVIRACGGSKLYITAGLFLMPLLTVTVSFLLGTVLYYTVLIHLPNAGYIELQPVSGGIAASVYILMLLYCLMFLFLPIWRFLKGGCKG